jgi:hypothetical protein
MSDNKKTKGMSFGKLLAIFGGGMLVLMIGTVVALKAIQAGKQSSKVIRHNVQEADISTSAPIALEPMITVERPTASSQASSATATSIASASMNAASASTTMPTTMPKEAIQLIGSTLNDHEMRIRALEESRVRVKGIQKRRHAIAKRRDANRHEEITSTVTTKKNPSSGEITLIDTTPASDLSGYRVEATVGKRAWVTTPNGLTTVTVNDAIPSRSRIKTVDRDAGEVTTSDNQIIRSAH